MYNEDCEDQPPQPDKRKEFTARAIEFLTDQPPLKTSLVIAQYLQKSGDNNDHPLAQLTTDSPPLHVAVAFELTSVVKELASKTDTGFGRRDPMLSSARLPAQSLNFSDVERVLQDASSRE